MPMSARSRRMFADAVRRDPVDVGLACLLIAHEADPAADAGEVRALLDSLAGDTRPLLAELAGHRRPGAFRAGETQPGELRPGETRPGETRPGELPPGELPPGELPPGELPPGELRAGDVRAGGARPGKSRNGESRAGEIWAGGSGGAPAGIELRAAAEALRASLGLRAGFSGTAEDYDDLRSSLLPAVLRRRRGLPILLSVVWLEVARRLGLPAYPVGLPGHIVVAIGSPADNVLVDPFAGGRLITVHEAAEKVRATGTPFTRAHLAPLPPVDLLTRVLTNIRVLAARADSPRTRLWAVELSLLMPRASATLRRERGEILVRLGDFLGGAADLAEFADAVASVEPAAAAAARHAALAAGARLN
jgi:regulator of sirC expression with transglutaminase-like and TPR domain